MQFVRESLESKPASRSRLSLEINGSRALYALSLVLLAGVYFGAAKFGLSLASVHTNVSPVWPPTGIALAAVLLLGVRVWPGIFIGALIINIFTPVPAGTAFGIAIGNTLEAVIAARVLSAVEFRPSLDRARDVFKFVVVASLCTGLSATIGVLSLSLGHAASSSNLGSLWITWWLGDLTGAVTVAPLILVWSSGKNHWLPKQRYLEATLLIILLSLSAIATFGGRSPTSLPGYPLVRLTIPFLLWAAFRLGRRGVTVSIAVLSAFAIWGTSNGWGPFGAANPNEALMMLQLFIASNALTFLFLVTVIEERLLAETRQREDQKRLQANLAVTQIVAESPEVSVALQRILPTVGDLLGWEFGCVWTPASDGKALRSVAIWDEKPKPQFAEACRSRTFDPGVGLPGRVWASGKPAWIRDVADDDNFPRRPIAVAEGLHGAFAFPIVFNEKFLGVMEFFSHEIRQPDEQLLAMFAGIGSQIGQFIERKRTEEVLLKHERRFREMIDALPAAIYTTDAEGRLTHFNQAAVEFSGRVPELGADQWCVSWKLYHADGTSMPHDKCPMAIAIKEGRILNGVEAIAERPDGQRVWFTPYPTPLRDESGQIVGGINMLVDITARKLAEERLRESEAQTRRALDYAEATLRTSPVPLLVLEEDARVDTANEAFYSTFQVTPEETEGRLIYELGNGQWNIPELRELLEEVLSHRPEFRDFEVTHDFENLGRRTMLLNARRMDREPDAPRRIVLNIDDITLRKRAEGEFRHLAAIVKTTDDAVISKDLDGIITSWNPAAERLYGYKSEEVVGEPVSILIPPEWPDEEPQILARLRRGEAIDHYETVRVAKNGRRLHVSLTVSPITDASGKVIGASKIARDITEQKRAQEEIARLLVAERTARQDAEIASRTKDEFLATLSHELRTPLTAMLGWLTILRAHKLDKKTAEHAIETIERNAKAQAQLIEDLVDVSRIVGGKLNLEVIPTELMPVIDAAIEVVRPAADAKEITIEVNYDATIGPVAGDAARLQQVIWNLLSNAVKFTPKGGTVTVEFCRHNEFAEVVVRDTGIGIAPDFLPHVFERFRQAESSSTRTHRGMGLGLAIVRHLIELHGGTVTAASEGENRGSTFTFHLPLASAPKQRVAAAAAHKSNGDDAEALKGLRILLVEDEPDARELISMLLQTSGAHVESVDSVKDALQSLSQFAPDVLLSDIGLPHESGYDLIRQVRAMPTDLRKIPAIALTAFASENDRKLSLSSGFQAHLAKPVEPSDLLSTIKLVINGKH